MRVVKNSKAALEARQTRPCVVRLHKVNANNLIYPTQSNRRSYTTKITRSSPKVSEQLQKQHIMNEKVFRGPLKKRPINDGGNQKSSQATPNAASRNKMKATPKRSEPVEETPPPTIAASRSRRSIKPNPKYASEDIVTPKTIRATTTVPNSASAKRGGLAGSQANNLGGKQKIAQPQYESSSEDFFNKDTSEEDSALDDDDGRGDDDVKMLDKPYEILDSSDSDIEQLIKAAQPKKRVGRPKKNADSSSVVSKAPEYESSNVVKSTPSQLQQMRRSLANTQTSSNPRTPATPSSVTLKRKFPGMDNADSISRKRVLLAPGGVRQLKDAAAQSPERQQTVELPTRKSMPVGLTVTRVKLPTEGAGGGGNSQQSTAQEQRRILMAKTLARTGTTMTKSSSSATTTKSVQSNATPTQNEQRSSTNAQSVQRSTASRAMTVVAKGGRSSSPTTTAATAATTRQTKESSKKIIMEDLTDDDPVSAAATPEDFDSMPTFTIVNINDIINKKGDALISRSSSPPPQTTPQTKSPGQNAKVQRTGEENTNNNNQKLPLAPAGATKPGMRRRGPASKVLAEKQQTEKQQQQQVVANSTRQGQQKKSTPTILNHTLKQQQQTRPVRGAAQKSPEKPAPRILNSMVAKKTEPIKPVIANLDDSADESLPLSMDDDDDDDETEDDSSAAEQPPRRQYNTKSKAAGKSSTPAAKENSSALTNCTNNNNNNSSSNKLAMLKSSPEKVIIQRQGDKIIKKVTCFENWYVLSVIDEKPPQPARNQLDMPLVKLANLTEDIALPSDNWTVKVTLYELSPSTLANSALITYTGDLGAHNIAEEDRAKYQPSCVMFRRSVTERQLVRLPYDRAVIFKNKTFFTNISGKNVRLVGAPSKISSQEDVEILLEIVNDLTLESTFVEPATMTQ